MNFTTLWCPNNSNKKKKKKKKKKKNHFFKSQWIQSSTLALIIEQITNHVQVPLSLFFKVSLSVKFL